MLNVVDEFSRECLSIRVARRLNSTSVIDVLSDLFILRGVPGHVRSDNGPEFIAKAVQAWIGAVGAKTAYIAPGSPWAKFSRALAGDLIEQSRQPGGYGQRQRGQGDDRAADEAKEPNLGCQGCFGFRDQVHSEEAGYCGADEA